MRDAQYHQKQAMCVPSSMTNEVTQASLPIPRAQRDSDSLRTKLPAAISHHIVAVEPQPQDSQVRYSLVPGVTDIASASVYTTST
jgi:hypothetical protein